MAVRYLSAMENHPPNPPKPDPPLSSNSSKQASNEAAHPGLGLEANSKNNRKGPSKVPQNHIFENKTRIGSDGPLHGRAWQLPVTWHDERNQKKGSRRNFLIFLLSFLSFIQPPHHQIQKGKEKVPCQKEGGGKGTE